VSTDSELIARVLRADDRAAFGELVTRHQSAVRQFLRHLTNDQTALADDLAQETFIDAFRNLGRFRGQSSFTTWLLGIARNHHRNTWRRQQHERAFAETTARDAAEAFAPPATHGADLRHDLAAAIQDLSPDEQLALHLAYAQGLAHSEIAALVDWPLGTVKTHLARSKEKLRHLLAAWNPQT
jgi:RNA polymerase sigma-70 factor, ECF subfamily